MSKFNYYHIISEIQKAYSIKELETISTQNLNLQMSIESVKIISPSQQSWLDQNKTIIDKKSFLVQQKIDNKSDLTCYFIREKKFTSTEKKQLKKVSDKIFNCCEKIIRLEASQYLKNQWDTTFNSIATPICLTDKKFNITRTNELFASNLNLDSKDIIGKNAFKTYLGSENISFKTNKNDQHFSSIVHKTEYGIDKVYDVQCQLIDQKKHHELYDNKQYLIVFRNITEDKKLEKQIFESAKYAELGTIGSSIAHELNNPIAGILAFLQLIKTDLPDNSKHKDDINEMEAATIKCKNIVENLLGFSRKNSGKENISVELSSVINKAITISELKAKPIGISIDSLSKDFSNIFVSGNKNLLTQAFSHLLQSAITHLTEQLNKNIIKNAKINFSLKASPTKDTIIITDNRMTEKNFSPFKSVNNLGLTVAYKIFKDHNFDIEISSQPNLGVQAKISFQRLDLLDERQVFDAKI